MASHIDTLSAAAAAKNIVSSGIENRPNIEKICHVHACAVSAH